MNEFKHHNRNRTHFILFKYTCVIVYLLLDIRQKILYFLGIDIEHLNEVEKGRETTESLTKIRLDMQEILDGSSEILRASEESAKAAIEVPKGSEIIAATAEEQSSACQESLKTIKQAAQELSEPGDALVHRTRFSNRERRQERPACSSPVANGKPPTASRALRRCSPARST